MADYQAEARKAARRYGLDPNVFVRQIRQESGFNPHARSPAGAVGIAQIMPATARGWGVNPNDPVASLNAAAKNMARYVKQYGSYRNALVAYNAGPGRVGKSLPAETQNYIRVILGGRDPGRLSRPRSSGGATASAASVSSGSPGRAERIRTITETTPGVDNRFARAALIQSFLDDHSSIDPLDFAVQANALKDIAPTSTSRTVRTPGTPAVAGRSASGRSSGGSVMSGSVHSPVGRQAKVIGTPHSGTHTLGNWQSDNAVDIAVPIGTPMVALQDGVVVKVRHHPQGSGRFAGDQITVRGANGNEYFYAHGVAHVKPGQRIRRGQKLGTTGSANGVAHLHFGQERGDPRQHT